MLKLLNIHWLLTFMIMLCMALIFGLCSFNIFFLAKANITLVLDFGLTALADGAFIELLMLSLYGIISLACFLIFEACKDILIKKMLNEHESC